MAEYVRGYVLYRVWSKGEEGLLLCFCFLQLSPFVSAVRARLKDMQTSDLASASRRGWRGESPARPGCALVIDGKVGNTLRLQCDRVQ